MVYFYCSETYTCAYQEPFLFSALARKEKRFLDSKEKRAAGRGLHLRVFELFSRGYRTYLLSCQRDDAFVTYQSALGATGIICRKACHFKFAAYRPGSGASVSEAFRGRLRD